MSFYIIFDTIIALLSAIASIMIAYLRWSTNNEKVFSDKVYRIIDKYMNDRLKDELIRDIRDELQSENTQRLIEHAVNNSEVAKNIQRLILILCTNEDGLKNTSICKGE
jgi:histidyl-tRNA synthetase